MDVGNGETFPKDRDKDNFERIKYRIVGSVQGVGMRAWIAAMAQQRGLGGWVRNEADSSVAALFIGEHESLKDVEGLLWQGAPAASVVEVCKLTLDNLDQVWDFTSGFSVRHDS